MKVGPLDLPQMTTAERDALEVSAPSLIWNTDENRAESFTPGSGWDGLQQTLVFPDPPTAYSQVRFTGRNDGLNLSRSATIITSWQSLRTRMIGSNTDVQPIVDFNVDFTFAGADDEDVVIPNTGIYYGQMYFAFDESVIVDYGMRLRRTAPSSTVVATTYSRIADTASGARGIALVMDTLFAATAGEQYRFEVIAEQTTETQSPFLMNDTYADIWRYTFEQIA